MQIQVDLLARPQTSHGDIVHLEPERGDVLVKRPGAVDASPTQPCDPNRRQNLLDGGNNHIVAAADQPLDAGADERGVSAVYLIIVVSDEPEGLESVAEVAVPVDDVPVV